MKYIKQLTASFSMLLATSLSAATYSLPDDGGDVVGQMTIIYSEQGDTLTKIGMRHEVGYNEIKKANPNIRRKKLLAGTPVVIPTAHVIPNVAREGLVINLADMRLYYFPNPETVVTFPVAIGKSGWSTPQGTTYIKQKKRHPTWTPPASIRRAAAKRGKKLRRVYPAGPNNPLGTRALRLGMPGYLIHGTNKPWTIGQRRSHGCIRMRRNDVEALFELVEVGLPVKIIKQPSRQLALPTPPVNELQLIENKILAAANEKKTIAKTKKYRKQKKRLKRLRRNKSTGKVVISATKVQHNIPKKYLIPADVFKPQKMQSPKSKQPGTQTQKEKPKRKVVDLDELLG